MSKYLIDQIEATPNITVETGTEVIGMSGNGHLECLTLKTPRGEEARPRVPCSSLSAQLPRPTGCRRSYAATARASSSPART